MCRDLAKLWFIACVALSLCAVLARHELISTAEGADGGSSSAADLPLLLDENFSQGADRWEPASPEGWKIIDIDGGKAYSEFKNIDISKKLPHRSPWNIALLKDFTVTDFVLEVKMRETAKDYPHRDACLVLGYQNPSHFYYVHFAPVTGDLHADQIFIVNNADRAAITDKDHPSTGAKWGDQATWHRLKIVRHAADGLIEAYFHEDDAPFSDADRPLMTAHDKTFPWGQVGIGTFDDTADFAEVKLWGNKVKPSVNDVDTPSILAPQQSKP
jgi:hypothetical protein